MCGGDIPAGVCVRRRHRTHPDRTAGTRRRRKAIRCQLPAPASAHRRAARAPAGCPEPARSHSSQPRGAPRAPADAAAVSLTAKASTTAECSA
eukprot:798594-Prymnesium_polylepis.1